MESPKYKEQYQPSEAEQELIDKEKESFNEAIKGRKRDVSDRELIESGANYKVDEHGTRLDPTDKQIEEVRKEMNKKKGVEEPESKETKTTNKSPETFNTNSNKEDFDKLTSGAKEVVSNIYNNVKVGFVDRMQAVRSNKLYNYHKERAEKIENELTFKKRAIEQIEADTKTHKIRIENLRTQFPDGLTSKAENEIKKEENKLEQALKKANIEENDLLAEQILNKKKEEKYEKSRNEIIGRIEAFVGEKIAPHEEKIESLRSNIDTLDAEIKDSKDKRDVFIKELEEWKDKVSILEESSGGILASEKTIYKGKIKEIENTIKDYNDSINSINKNKNKINTKISKLHTKTDYWNEVLRKAKEDGMPKQQEETPDSTEDTTTPETEQEEVVNPEDNKEWYDAVMPSEESIDKYNKEKDRLKAMGIPDENIDEVMNAKIAPERQDQNTPETEEVLQEEKLYNTETENGVDIDELGQKEISANDYIDRWNKIFGGRLFGNDMKLDENKILEILDIPKGINKLPLKRIEEGIVEYNNNKSYFSRVSKDELNRMFKSIREYEQ